MFRLILCLLSGNAIVTEDRRKTVERLEKARQRCNELVVEAETAAQKKINAEEERRVRKIAKEQEAVAKRSAF